jgi:ABC-type Na+ efflux pump permease subunit
VINPVLRKDIIGLLRLKRVAAIQLFFILVLAMLVLMTWPQGGVISGTVDVGDSTGNTSIIRQSDNLLLGLVIGQIALLALFVPGVAAVSLSGEKEANTLEMLYATRLKPREIILGKIGIAIAYPVLLLITGLPFVAMLSLRGDVRTEDLLWSYLILGLTAVFLAVLSLTVSALSSQSSTALVVSYMIVLVVCGALLVPALIMLDGAMSPIADVLHYSRSLSPIAAAFSLLRPQPNDFDGSMHQFLPAWQVFVPGATLVIAVCIGILIGKLRQAPSSSEGFGAVGGSEEERSLGRKILYLIDPKKKRKPIGGINPVIAKERRTNNLRSGRMMIRIFYGALLLSLGLAIMSLFGGTEHKDLLKHVAMIVVAFQIGIIGLVVPSLTTSSVSSEIENNTFEILRLAPLKGGQIFWGKFVPSFIPAILPILALLPAYGAMCYINEQYIVRIEKLMPVVVMAVVFCCTLGLTGRP